MPLRSSRILSAIAALTLVSSPRAVRADISPPQDVYELRARDPQQPVQAPERLLFPRWQEERRASLYGWVDCGIGGNTLGGDFNGPIGLQDRNLQAMMNQLYLVGERLIDVDSDDWQWGARVDLLYGTDGWQTNARGLDAYPFDQFDDFGVPRWGSSRYYSLVMPQLYGEIARGDFSVLVGHFYTPLGYETVPAVGNFFYTHSHAFMYGTPNTHTGVLVYWQPDDRIRVGSGVTNGWDNFSDGVPAAANPDYPGAASNLAYLGSLTLASEDGGQLLTVAISTGNEYSPVIDPAGTPQGVLVGNRSMITAYWQNEVAERLTSVTEGHAAWQFNADTGLQNSGQLGGLAQWYGVSQYFYRGLTDTLSAGLRLEWYRDNNGFRIACPARNAATNTAPVADGFAGNLWAATVGCNWTPNSNWIVRPEVRYDWYTPAAYGTGVLPFGPITTRTDGLVTGDAFGQWYLGCDAIFQF